MFDESINEESGPNNVSKEIENYFNAPVIHIDDSPTSWWKFNENSYPNMFILANKYLCAQVATSVPSERIFSKGGYIVDDNRTSLTSEHVSELIFLACNKNLVNLCK